jgi:hypothetical protein
MRFVEGVSKDYVYPSADKHGEQRVVDHGGCSAEGLVEILARYFDELKATNKDAPLEAYMIQQLAARLNVNLRDKPLSWEEAMDKTVEHFKKEKERWPQNLKEFFG